MKPWQEFCPEERCKLLEAAPGQLQGMGLTAITVVSVKSESLALAKHECAELPGDSEGCDDSIFLMGFASDAQSEVLNEFHSGLGISDLEVAVNKASGPTPPGCAVCEACLTCWSRCAASPADVVPRSDVGQLRALLESVVARAGGPALLRLSEHDEIWVTSTGTTAKRAAQIEGFAPVVCRSALGRYAVLAEAVCWYEGSWPGQILKARCLAGPARGWSRPEVPLRLAPSGKLGDWLEGQESAVGSALDPQCVLRLAATSSNGTEEAWSFPSETNEAFIGGKTCDIFYFSEILSAEDCEKLVAMALCFQQPTAKRQPATAVPLPTHCRVPGAVETRLRSVMARCTGEVAIDGLVFDMTETAEVEAALVWEEAESRGLRSSRGAGVEVAVRLTAWLSPTTGGEIIFPEAEAQFRTDQDLMENEASERMLQPRPGSVVVVTRHEESW
ncbi:CDC48 [Symbiodinium sp. CCMP2592]|nr:CDC48 [Symbiodinium sp. CCMP2592]